MPLTHHGAQRGQSVRDPLPTVTAAHRGEQALAAAVLVPVTHTRDTARDVQQPLGTITTANGGEMAVASAYLVQAGHGEGAGPTKRRSHGAKRATDAIGTVTASGSGGQSLACAYMVQANGGYNATPARDLRRPMSAVTATGSQQQLIAAHMVTLRHNATGRRLEDPLATIATNGHHMLAQYTLSQAHEADALRCAAFLMRYHSSGGQWASPRDPMTAITTKDRLALVTVWLRGEPWVIVDICLRMLTPRELYRAQDFPASYVIDRTAAGKALTKTAQVRMCGNSVCPLAMRLVVAANYPDCAKTREEIAA